MLDATVSETAVAKQVNDTDRVRTRAIRLMMSGSGLVKIAGAVLRIFHVLGWKQIISTSEARMLISPVL